jgi:TonB family protein
MTRIVFLLILLCSTSCAEPLASQRRAVVVHNDLRSVGLRWVQAVNNRIRPNFATPSAVPEDERDRLATTVFLVIDENGRITKRQITKGSGNARFDDAVLHAFDTSNPLPAPPAELRDQIVKDGVEVTFSLGKKS